MSEARMNILGKNDFILDEAVNVWVPREGVRKFAYQDGDEAQLLEKILACSDRSTYSEELLPYRSWSQEYHLSPQRSNILAPLRQTLNSGTRVLEVGAGCGAITRALGERGCIVDAVEGSFDRATIAAARCRDLPSVRVYCSDFARVDFGAEAYDLVTLIGVLEYATLFFDTPAPFDFALSIASRHIATQGRLFVAIENQLGLKYFNGMKEDHVGVAFYGIQGMYQKGRKTAQTFTKKSLSDLIARSGLAELQFFYPYPDYKLPAAVLTEQALTDDRLRASQIVSRCRSREYSSTHTPLFHEASVLDTLAQGGLAGHFANSFAVVASRVPLHAPRWATKTFSNRRHSQFCIETTIQYEGDELRVIKARMCSERPARESNTSLVQFMPPQDDRFHDGPLLSFELASALYLPAKDCWPETLRLLLEWMRFLKRSADDLHRLDGAFYDAVPGNLIRADGDLQYFDAEWCVGQKVPLLLPVIRGLVSTFGGIEEDVWIAKVPYSSLRDLCVDVLAGENLPTTVQEINNCIRLDARIHEAIYPAVSRFEYQRAIEAAFFRDLRRARFRKSAKTFIGAARNLLRSTPVLGAMLTSLLAAARK